mgnify:CR=1 FL=1
MLYHNLLTSCRFDDYFVGVEEKAQTLFEQTIKSLAKQEQITEKLKAENMMLWI